MSTLAAFAHDRSVDISARLLDAVTADYRRCEFAVRFWNGDVWGKTKDPSFTLVLKHPGALRRMLSGASELTLGEAFIYDDVDVEGNLEAAFEFGDYLVAQDLGLTKKLRLASLLLRLPHDGHSGDHLAPHLVGSAHSKPRDRQAVKYHYDLSNDFYSLWLDRRMVYSCAYFESGDEDIHSAQTKKLDYICRKLRLRPGERLLDVGCGWGGLILYASKNFGVIARGVTLSQRQAELARERIEEAGLSDRCEVQVCDYRDLEESPDYDKIVSVGMFEHVGESGLPEYFQKAWKLLRAGGVFLNHGIAVSATYRRKGPSFIDKYVFPDGGLVPLGITVQTAESCGFEVRNVESLREHYVCTLRHWVRRLEARCEDAKRITGETLYRVWRIYMAGSAHSFARGRVNIYQVVFSKPEKGNASKEDIALVNYGLP